MASGLDPVPARASIQPRMSFEPTPQPTFAEALRFWGKLGLISFGGPAGQIAIMHRELVDVRRWITESRFLSALNFCMLLPGPEALQVAIYLGWRLHGIAGGLAAGLLFILPSMIVMFALSWLFVAGSGVPALAAVFHGLAAAVLAVLAHALSRIGRRTLRSPALWTLAILAFAAIFLFDVSFVLIVVGAGLAGALGHVLRPELFPPTSDPSHDSLAPDGLLRNDRAAAKSMIILIIGLVLWWGPLAALGGWLGWSSTPVEQGLFFSKAALVTFGGAYAVLPYVAQQAVEHHGWLTQAQMMTGLALAETTPGPLVIVLQFVGFVGGWQHPGQLPPLAAAALASLVTSWVTFLPSFLFILMAAPFLDGLGRARPISAALSAITASVVGVILNMAVRFTTHAVWPEGAATDWFVLLLAASAWLVLAGSRVGLLPVIAGCGLAGFLHWWCLSA